MQTLAFAFAFRGKHWFSTGSWPLPALGTPSGQHTVPVTAVARGVLHIEVKTCLHRLGALFCWLCYTPWLAFGSGLKIGMETGGDT